MSKNRLRSIAIICICVIVTAAIIATSVITGLGITGAAVIDTAAVMSGIGGIVSIALGTRDDKKGGE